MFSVFGFDNFFVGFVNLESVLIFFSVDIEIVSGFPLNVFFVEGSISSVGTSEVGAFRLGGGHIGYGSGS